MKSFIIRTGVNNGQIDWCAKNIGDEGENTWWWRWHSDGSYSSGIIINIVDDEMAVLYVLRFG